MQNETNVTIAIISCFNGYSQQTLNQSIIHDNLQRDYIIYIPSVYNVSDPIPLVFCFHGYGGNANSILSYTSFNSISDTAGFIVVYPQGTLLQGTPHWNVGGWTLGSNIDDVGFSLAAYLTHYLISIILMTQEFIVLECLMVDI